MIDLQVTRICTYSTIFIVETNATITHLYQSGQFKGFSRSFVSKSTIFSSSFADPDWGIWICSSPFSDKGTASSTGGVCVRIKGDSKPAAVSKIRGAWLSMSRAHQEAHRNPVGFSRPSQRTSCNFTQKIVSTFAPSAIPNARAVATFPQRLASRTTSHSGANTADVILLREPDDVHHTNDDHHVQGRSQTLHD